MDDSVMNIGAEVQQIQNGMTGEPGLPEPAPAQGPEVKQETEAKQEQPPVKQMNPALKYGRRMDYKTAKVSEKPSRYQTRPLTSLNNVRNTASTPTTPDQNVSAPSANSGQSVSAPSSNSGQSASSPSSNSGQNISAPSSNGEQNASQISSNGNQNTLDEPKSALELELEAIESAKAASQPIHNPLPTPKKRVPKEMEFDIEPSEYEMHFDLVELNGRDFFDIN